MHATIASLVRQASFQEALIQVIQRDLSSSLETITRHETDIQAAEDEKVKQQLCVFRDEEIDYFGELVVLLDYLDPGAASLYFEGREEVA